MFCSYNINIKKHISSFILIINSMVKTFSIYVKRFSKILPAHHISGETI